MGNLDGTLHHLRKPDAGEEDIEQPENLGPGLATLPSEQTLWAYLPFLTPKISEGADAEILESRTAVRSGHTGLNQCGYHVQESDHVPWREHLQFGRQKHLC